MNLSTSTAAAQINPAHIPKQCWVCIPEKIGFRTMRELPININEMRHILLGTLCVVLVGQLLLVLGQLTSVLYLALFYYSHHFLYLVVLSSVLVYTGWIDLNITRLINWFTFIRVLQRHCVRDCYGKMTNFWLYFSQKNLTFNESSQYMNKIQDSRFSFSRSSQICNKKTKESC